MRPTLFSLRLFGHEIGLHSYGLAIALGFAAGIFLAARQARRLEMNVPDVLDLSFWMLVAGLLGSRVMFVLLNAGDYARLCTGFGQPRTAFTLISDCTAVFRLWEGGLVFYGGAVASTIVVAITARRRGWSFGKVADVFAPSLALGHAFGRIGCFAAGCCFGKLCPSSWAGAVSFPPGSVAFEDFVSHGLLAPTAHTTLALHATQLYEAAGELLIFFTLLALRRRQRAYGSLALSYALMYAILRGLGEVFRGDAGRRFLIEISTPRVAAWLGLPPREPLLLSTSQTVSLILAIGAAWGLRALHRREPARPAG